MNDAFGESGGAGTVENVDGMGRGELDEFEGEIWSAVRVSSMITVTTERSLQLCVCTSKRLELRLWCRDFDFDLDFDLSRHAAMSKAHP